MVTCFLCKRQFQLGAEIYEGNRVTAWDIAVCHRCRRANHDGIIPGFNSDLLWHLKVRGIEPRKNAKGWLCWPEPSTADGPPSSRSG
jgi:hypothetical protein